MQDLVEHWGKEEATAERLCKVLQTAKGCSVRFAETVATHSPEERLLKQLHQQQQQLLLGQQALLEGQQNIKKTVLEVGAQLSEQLRSNASMLGHLLQGEHDCPRWLVLVPKPEAESKLERAAAWLQPKNWVNKTAVLHFVCPVTRTAVGTGFELQLPRDWVLKYGPAIRIGMTLLKVGAAGARLAGLPIPSLKQLAGAAMDTLEKQKEYLEELTEGIQRELDENGLESVNGWVSEKPEPVIYVACIHIYVHIYIYLGIEEARGCRGHVHRRGGRGREELKELPAETKEAVKRSYAEVLSLLELLQPTEQTWEQKVRPTNRPLQG